MGWLMDEVIVFAGMRVLLVASQGPKLENGRDANDLLSAAWSQKADFLAIPVSRLGPDFLNLSTRVAGEVLQKFVTYGMRCAIVGDLAANVMESRALRDSVREANRGRSVWFVADLDELRVKILGDQVS
jgi:hypothetical protein